MELRVEVRFIDEGDFVNKRKGFIVKDNQDWEIDSSISLDFADILDFEEELMSAICDSVGEISNSSATIDDSDASDCGEGTSATKKKKYSKGKKPTAKNKQRAAEEMIVALNNQNSQPSFRLKPCHSAATSMRYCQSKNTNKKANRGANQNWKKNTDAYKED